MQTLPLLPSFQLNKLLTILKNTFRETACRHFLSAKFDNDISSFFVDNPDQKFLLFKNQIGLVHSYSSPHFIWTSSWLGWKNTFRDTAYRHFFERKVCQRHECSFREQPRWKLPSISVPTRRLTLLHYPSFHLNKSLTRLKNAFRDTAYRQFLSAKIDNDMSVFFINNQIKKFFCFSTY